jgi:hypothetical protein
MLIWASEHDTGRDCIVLLVSAELVDPQRLRRISAQTGKQGVDARR